MRNRSRCTVIILLLLAAVSVAGPAATEPSEVTVTPQDIEAAQRAYRQMNRHITFVVDVRDPNGDLFEPTKSELKKAIQGLRPIQAFGVIFVRKEGCIALEKTLINATPENKVKAIGFLQGVKPEDTGDTLPAIEMAFAQKPQLIYLLTNHDFPNDDQVLTRVSELNPRHETKVNTLGFGTDETGPLADLLKEIAMRSGGVYKRTAIEELKSPTTQPTTRP